MRAARVMHVLEAFPGKVCDIMVAVAGNEQRYLPMGATGEWLTTQFLGAAEFAAWLREEQIMFLTREEFTNLGVALPVVVKAHLMLQLATLGCLPAHAARYYWMSGQLILAEHRRFLRVAGWRVSAI